jgi:hypothetical protein
MKYTSMLITVCAIGCAVGPAIRADEVTDWSQIFFQSAISANTGAPALARFSAILHTAVFDAVNGIERKYTPVHVPAGAPPGASARAAAVAAAYEALLNFYPTQKSTLDAAFSASLARIANRTAAEHSISIQLGVLWGKYVADQIIEWRANDGFTAVLPPYTGGSEPGQWRPTPPAFAPGAGLQLATMTPWVIVAPSQFPPAGPPPLTSPRYTADFNETKTMGSVESATRTPEETLYSQFWASSNTTDFWEDVALSLSAERHLSLSANARLMALVSLANADGLIASFNAKYTYSFWRPITAIQSAETDDNPFTEADPAWTPLVGTPPFPEYPSNHAMLSAAAISVLANVFGEKTTFTVESSGMSGVTRSFSSFSLAAEEVKNARVFGGIHFRTACKDGQALGNAVGNYVLDHVSLPITGKKERENAR